MIPIISIEPENLYSQDDASFLLGDGFSADAAREAVSEACRSGELKSRRWRKRSWFSGRAFLAWVEKRFGDDTDDVVATAGRDLAPRRVIEQDRPTDPEPVAARKGGGR